jgi:hypothetical protein
MIIELFFVCRKYKQVREIIVYANNVFDIIDRYKIQNKDNNVLNKFQPRRSFKRRSV